MRASYVTALLTAFVSATEKLYYSGEIMTHETFRYGKFRASIQGSGQLGTIASLFTFWNG